MRLVPRLEAAGLHYTFGSVRVWDRRPFVLDAIARDHPRALEIAAHARRLGMYARVTQVRGRGILLADGQRIRQAWIVWTRPRQLSAAA